MSDPTQLEQHPAYRLTWWALHSGDVILPLALAVCVLGVFAGTAYLWFLTGARIIAAGWVWQQFVRSVRSGARVHHAGGRGATGRHSPEYVAFMASPAWKAQRARVLRRDGRRCRDCGGRASDVHHEFYSEPIAATPDWALTPVCAGCHDQRHGRAHAS